jgi:putative hydrolase of the HAD superfamily
MVIVFDLDDTLYEELSFVRSGMKAAADFLSPILSVSRHEIFQDLMNELAVQRERVFDRYLEKMGRKSGQLVQKCVSAYRLHEPSIALYPEAVACLNRFRHYPLYIVTDGNKIVQRKKVQALGLEKWIKKSFYTNAHGLRHQKPSPYCFEKICRIENVPPPSVFYVADNPSKDFVGLKPLGFHTIRVHTGLYGHQKAAEDYEAETNISDLNALTEELILSIARGKP